MQHAHLRLYFLLSFIQVSLIRSGHSLSGENPPFPAGMLWTCQLHPMSAPEWDSIIAEMIDLNESHPALLPRLNRVRSWAVDILPEYVSPGLLPYPAKLNFYGKDIEQ